jgi:hypothetical protein
MRLLLMGTQILKMKEGSSKLKVWQGRVKHLALRNEIKLMFSVKDATKSKLFRRLLTQ